MATLGDDRRPATMTELRSRSRAEGGERRKAKSDKQRAQEKRDRRKYGRQCVWVEIDRGMFDELVAAGLLTSTT
jgi:hypothetical protein